jgi:hypothetical protein
MLTIARSLCVIVGMLTIAFSTYAQSSLLWVTVMDIKGNTWDKKVTIGTEGPGMEIETDARGRARIKLDPSIRPGDQVTLKIFNRDLAFISPWDGIVRVPLFGNPSQHYVKIYIITRGDRNALQSGRFAIQMAKKFNAAVAPRLKSQGDPGQPRVAAQKELEAYTGLKWEEIELAIRNYREKTSDPLEKGDLELAA